MWDIKEYEERIKNPRGDHRDKDLFIVRRKFSCKKNSILFFQPGFEDETYFQTPHIRYCAVSSIEHSHSDPITDLQWIPDHFQVRKILKKYIFKIFEFQITAQGLPTENLAMNCSQIMTCAFDT